MDTTESNEFRVDHPEPLTPREAQVLLWTAEGKTAWEAGKILGITEGTARIHLGRILGKLRASNKPHAIARAFGLGILAAKAVVTIMVICCSINPPDDDASRAPRRPNRRAERSESLAGFGRRL